jgi:multidrug efflux pump subunit AcrA (membrane-fusion protein)
MVVIQPVEYREYKAPVRATGMLTTATEMKLSFKTGGIIKQIVAREGSSVKRGDVLAETGPVRDQRPGRSGRNWFREGPKGSYPCRKPVP